MFSVHCTEKGAEVLLGPRSILSMHNTAKGVTGYYRCACGALGVFEQDRVTGEMTYHHRAGASSASEQRKSPEVTPSRLRQPSRAA